LIVDPTCNSFSNEKNDGKACHATGYEEDAQPVELPLFYRESDGHALGWYALSREAGSYNDVAFSRSGGFTLFTNEKGMLKVAQAPLR